MAQETRSRDATLGSPGRYRRYSKEKRASQLTRLGRKTIPRTWERINLNVTRWWSENAIARANNPKHKKNKPGRYEQANRRTSVNKRPHRADRTNTYLPTYLSSILHTHFVGLYTPQISSLKPQPLFPGPDGNKETIRHSFVIGNKNRQVLQDTRLQATTARQ